MKTIRANNPTYVTNEKAEHDNTKTPKIAKFDLVRKIHFELSGNKHWDIEKTAAKDKNKINHRNSCDKSN